jgi:threonine dehydrogenase-like Zn-dependent dehydrogenase
VIGVQRDGGFSEWVCVPFDHAIPAGNTTALDALALTEPLAVAMHAVNVAQIADAETPIVIIGDGTLGLLIAQILKRQGHQNLSLFGHHSERLEIARKMGVHTRQTQPESGPSSSEMAGYAFQVAGSSAAIRLGVEMLAGNGQMICLGYLDATRDSVDPFTINRLIRNEITLRGSFGSSRAEFEGVLCQMAEGHFDLTPLIGAKVSLDDIVERGFDALLGEPRPVGKVLVQPGTLE